MRIIIFWGYVLSLSTHTNIYYLYLMSYYFNICLSDPCVLFQDFAYELKDFLQHGVIYEDQRQYHHLNFTAKVKRADGCGVENLFFAEISHMQGEYEWVVSCCCIIKPSANGNISSAQFQFKFLILYNFLLKKLYVTANW